MRIELSLRLAPDLPQIYIEKFMIKRPGDVLQSKKIAGFLWILAGLLMMVPPIISEGRGSLIGIGAMFLILGAVSLRRDRKT